MGFVHNLLGQCAVHAGHLDQQLNFNAEAVRNRADANRGVDRRIGRQRDFLLACYKLHGTDKTRAIAGREQLLGVNGAGHTRILSSVSPDGGTHFAAPQQVNDAIWRGQMGGFGRGTGVMRVALSNYGPDGVAAVWADKRDFLAGYDVYAAFAPSPAFKFGTNEKAQDDFGNDIAQWHPAIGANRQGTVAVVWDDDRDGTPDIWLAWRSASGWSDNQAVPGASGPGVQSDPAIVLDEANNLHLAWVEKADLNSPSRIRYVMGRWLGEKK